MMLGGFGIPESASFVFNEGKLSVHAHSAIWNKMATCDFGPVTVISCEIELFFVYIWITLIGCNIQTVNTAFNRLLNSADR